MVQTMVSKNNKHTASSALKVDEKDTKRAVMSCFHSVSMFFGLLLQQCAAMQNQKLLRNADTEELVGSKKKRAREPTPDKLQFSQRKKPRSKLGQKKFEGSMLLILPPAQLAVYRALSHDIVPETQVSDKMTAAGLFLQSEHLQDEDAEFPNCYDGAYTVNARRQELLWRRLTSDQTRISN